MSTFNVPVKIIRAIVPTLYRGPYSAEKIAELTSGKSTLAEHIREGVVVTSADGRVDPRIGTVRLKSVSDAYLTRKGGTEFN